MNFNPNRILLSVLSFAFISIFYPACSSQKVNSSVLSDELTTAVNNDHWIFTASNIMTTRGGTIGVADINNRTANFVKLSKDSLISDLMYYAYIGQYSSSTWTLLGFESANFSLEKENKNGRWFVTIKRPYENIHSMTFTFFKDGSAQLNVSLANSTNWGYSSISYSGKVTFLENK